MCYARQWLDWITLLAVFVWLVEVVDTVDDAEADIDLHHLRKDVDPHRTIVFTSLVEPPFLMMRRNDGTARRPHHLHHDYEGFIPDLVAKIAQKLGVSYRLKLVSNGGYGVPSASTGEWNGMIGEVISGEADVAAGALSIKPIRMRVVDFTNPYLQVGIAAVVKKPSDLGAPLLIRSPTDLANQSEVSFGCIRGSQTYHYFRTSTNSVIKNMWRRMITSQPTTLEWSSSAGLERVRKSDGKFAFLLENVFAEYLAYRPPCDLYVSERQIKKSEYAFAVQKNSMLLQKINDILELFQSNGVIERLRHKWWRSKCEPKTGPRGKKGNKKLLSNDEPGYADNADEIDDLKEESVVAEKKNTDTQHRSGLHNSGGTIRVVRWSALGVARAGVMGMVVTVCWWVAR